MALRDEPVALPPPSVEADAPAPSLAVSSDASTPYHRLAFYVDPVSWLFDGYGFAVAAALGRYQVVVVAPRLSRSHGATGFGLDLAYEVHPLGRGLSGPFLGVRGGLGVDDADGRRRAARVGADAGYVYVSAGFLLGGSVGFVRGFGHAARIDPGFDFAGRVFLGFAWM